MLGLQPEGRTDLSMYFLLFPPSINISFPRNVFPWLRNEATRCYHFLAV